MVLGGLVRQNRNATALGSGRNPANLATGSTQSMAQLYDAKPLGSVSRSEAVAAARKAGMMQAQVLVAKSHQQSQQKQAQAYLDYISNNMDHAQFMMKIEQTLKQKQAKFGKAVARYEFSSDRTQQEYDGYTSVLHSSVSTFQNM